MPQKVPFDVKIQNVSAGLAHSCFIDYKGCVYVCGDNTHGQLGLGVT